MTTPPPLVTFGHGTADADRIAELLVGAGVTRLVDVRRFPGSRRHPHVARDVMAQWLPAAGVAYRWEPRLGGRRRVERTGDDASPDPWWQVEAFRAYAAYTRTHEFRSAMGELLADAQRHDAGRTAVLCSETVWWRCHRRLISDVAVLLHGMPVEHLAHDGRLGPHRPAAGARVAPDGLRYDVRPDPEPEPSPKSSPEPDPEPGADAAEDVPAPAVAAGAGVTAAVRSEART